MKRLILPIPPSVNRAYRNVRIDMRIKTDDAAQFLHDAGWTAKHWARQNEWRMPANSQKVIMRVWIWWPNAKRRDPDNIFKMLNDAIKGVLIEDDNMILPQVIDFEIDKQNPRVEVELELVEKVATT